jgi:Fe-S-cluster containining protein
VTWSTPRDRQNLKGFQGVALGKGGGICVQCGKCCVDFTASGHADGVRDIVVLLDKVGGFPLPVMLSEHTKCRVTVNLDNAPCKMWNPISKLCMDYLGRPGICRDHWCEEARGRKMDKEKE